MARSRAGRRTAAKSKRLAKPEAAMVQSSPVAFGEPRKTPLLSESERHKRMAKVKAASAVGIGEPPSEIRPVRSAAERGVGKLKKPTRGESARSRAG